MTADPHRLANVPDDAFVVGALRYWRASDLRRLDLWGDDDGVTLLTIHDHSGRSTTYCYTDLATAEDDYRRIMEGGARVILRGESGQRAHARAAAVIKAVGRTWRELRVRRGK